MREQRLDQAAAVLAVRLAVVGVPSGEADGQAARLVAPPVRARQPLRRRAQARQRRTCGAGVAHPLERSAFETAVPAWRREHVDLAGIRPAAQGVGVDSHQARGRTQRQP